MTEIKNKRIKLGLSQKDLANAIEKDVPLISKFENFICLPIPDDAKKLIKMLKCTSILELYEKEDITYIDNSKETFNDLYSYKLTAKLPRDAINWLTKENLKLLGYRSITEWIIKCYERLVKRIQKKSHFDENYQNDLKN